MVQEPRGRGSYGSARGRTTANRQWKCKECQRQRCEQSHLASAESKCLGSHTHHSMIFIHTVPVQVELLLLIDGYQCGWKVEGGKVEGGRWNTENSLGLMPTEE